MKLIRMRITTLIAALGLSVSTSFAALTPEGGSFDRIASPAGIQVAEEGSFVDGMLHIFCIRWSSTPTC